MRTLPARLAACLCALLILAAAPARADETSASADPASLLEEAFAAVNSVPGRTLEIVGELRGGDMPDDPVFAARLSIVEARARAHVGDYTGALAVGEAALSADAGMDPSLRAELVAITAFAAGRLDDTRRAFVLQREALALHRATGNVAGEAASVATLAEIYADLGMIGQARELYEDAIVLARRSGDDYVLIRALNNYAFVLAMNGGADESLPLLDEGRRIADEADNPRMRAFTNQNTGNTLYHLGRDGEAERYSLAALDDAQRLGQPELLSGIYFTLARIAARRGDLDTAVTRAREALAAARAAGYRERLSDINELLAGISFRRGDYRAAYDFLRGHATYLEEISASVRARSADLFTAQSEIAAKEQELALLRHDAEISALRLERAEDARNAAIAGTVLFAALVVVLVVLLRVKQKANRDIRAKNRELSDALAELARANKAKSNFLSVMSHELRTPLNAVLGFSDMIACERLGPVAHRSDRYLGFARDIHDQGGRLLRLVNDILFVTDAESGRLRLTENDTPVSAVADAALCKAREFRPDAEARVAVACEESGTLLHCDSGEVSGALARLIDNALKYSPAEEPVRLMGHCGADGSYVFRVEDHGSGIAAELVPVVLSAFRQADESLSRRHEGAGLGLPIVRAVAEAHGGTLAIDSAPVGGTVVTLTLPSPRVIAAAPPRKAAYA